MNEIVNLDHANNATADRVSSSTISEKSEDDTEKSNIRDSLDHDVSFRLHHMKNNESRISSGIANQIGSVVPGNIFLMNKHRHYEQEEEQQEELDGDQNNFTCTYLIDHHRRSHSHSGTQAMETNTKETNPHMRRFICESSTSSLGNTTTVVSKQEAAAAEQDDITNHDRHVPVPVQPPSDDEGGAFQNPRTNVSTCTFLTSHSGEEVGFNGTSNGGKKDDHVDKHDQHCDSHDEADEEANENLGKHTKKQKEDSAASTTFPQHLMDAIEQESQQDKPVTILDWVEGGNAFLIRDKDAFETIVIPKYFDRGGVNKCKFMSFVRKLYRQVAYYFSTWSKVFLLLLGIGCSPSLYSSSSSLGKFVTC